MSWQRFSSLYCAVDSLGVSLDVSRMNFDEKYFELKSKELTAAFDAMEALEQGAIANPDEKRQVGHYWLRAPGLAPKDIAPVI